MLNAESPGWRAEERDQTFNLSSEQRQSGHCNGLLLNKEPVSSSSFRGVLLCRMGITGVCG